MDFIQRSRHGTVYHFRRRVPKDLTAPLGRGEIVVSLHTEVRTTALRRARALHRQSHSYAGGHRQSAGRVNAPRAAT